MIHNLGRIFILLFDAGRFCFWTRDRLEICPTVGKADRLAAFGVPTVLGFHLDRRCEILHRDGAVGVAAQGQARGIEDDVLDFASGEFGEEMFGQSLFTPALVRKRKEVLSNILGLEMWEQYKNRSAERRKLIEREVDGIQARIAEIDVEQAHKRASPADNWRL